MVRTIYISWRKSSGARRFIIAKLQRVVDGVFFNYTKDFEKAKAEGLENFMGLKDETKFSINEAEKLLSLRIISKDRPDRNEFLQFWEAENTSDIFDLIALTQGKSPTDNIEFLADFLTVKTSKFKFVTDLAGLSHLNHSEGIVKKGDCLRYEKETSNIYDKNAVVVYKGDYKLGYIKQIHTNIFNLKRTLKLTVKAVDEKITIKQIFVKVEK